MPILNMKAMFVETRSGSSPSLPMLRSVKKICGTKLSARDGAIGNVQDFYFDDQSWAIRYVVAHTGSWLPGRLVLIAPQAFGSLSPDEDRLIVNLTREQIQNSPQIGSHVPVSRKYEEEYYRYYGWPSYWNGNEMWGLSGLPVAPPPDWEFIKDATQEDAFSNEDLNLRSAKALNSYLVENAEGEIGRLIDFVMDEESWEIRQLIVDTGHWFSGKEVAITPTQIERISYHESRIFVHVTIDAIREAHEFDAESSA